MARVRLPLLTTKEVAAELGITAGQVRQLIARGELLASNVGGSKSGGARWRVRPLDLDRFLEARRSG